MKYLLAFFSSLTIALIFIFCPFKALGQQGESEYLRIHIRANSNSESDQNVKYKVKEGVVDLLIPILADIDSFEEAKIVIGQNLGLIEERAEQILSENGFYYGCTAQIDNEYFPTRVYDELTLEEGYYDALILRLGGGEGDNWWCIVYPAFCFTSSQKSDNLVYISKIWDKLKEYRRKK